jgi:hypothetical protein
MDGSHGAHKGQATGQPDDSVVEAGGPEDDATNTTAQHLVLKTAVFLFLASSLPTSVWVLGIYPYDLRQYHLPAQG